MSIATEQPDEENSTTPYVKLIILDEADQMVPAAQMALRRSKIFGLKACYFTILMFQVIEMYASHVRFLIICNYVNKIIPAIQSRCTK
jgi:replication factor C subunit 3/5